MPSESTETLVSYETPEWLFKYPYLPRNDQPETTFTPSSTASHSTYSTSPENVEYVDFSPRYNSDSDIDINMRLAVTELTLAHVRQSTQAKLSHQTARKPKQGNEIAPTSLRPFVPAAQRLLMWTTPHSRITQDELNSKISLKLQEKIFDKFMLSTVKSTRESYGAGLLHFNQFCDREDILENHRMPADAVLLSAFILRYNRRRKNGTKLAQWPASLAYL